MKIDEIKTLIKNHIPDAQVSIEGEGCNFSVTVISEQFRDQSLLQRQKTIMSLFKEQIASGELHALSVKTRLPD